MIRNSTAAVCATALAAAIEWGGAQAQDVMDEHMRAHALRYASMIERAYGRLHGYIRNRSTAATTWSGAAIPPAATGWESVWTDAGLRARYCDGVLLVYIAPAELKGTGDQHRAIQQARRNYLAERETGVRLPMLSWLESGAVTDSLGNTGAVPGCMASDYTAPLPSGRAALAGDVTDPWTDVRERAMFETRESACPAGQHGEVRERRTVTQDFNAKGDPAGPQTFGPWVAAPGSWCRADYTYNEVYTTECSWTQGPPFNKTMTGTETWRIPVSVTADRAAEAETPPRYGVVKRSSGAPVFVSTTCWDGPPPTPPTPTSTVQNETETRTLSCGTGFTGSITESRTKTTATTTYPWAESQLVSIEYTNWSETANSCTLIPDDPDDSDDTDDPDEKDDKKKEEDDDDPKDPDKKDPDEEKDTEKNDNDGDNRGEGGDGADRGGPDSGGPDESAPDTGRDAGSNMDKDAITGTVDDARDDSADNGQGEGGDGNDGGGYGGDGGGDSGGSPHR